MIDASNTTLGVWEDQTFRDLDSLKGWEHARDAGRGRALLAMAQETDYLTDDWSLMLRTVMDRLTNVAGELAPQWEIKKALGLIAPNLSHGRRGFIEILEARSPRVMKRQGVVKVTMHGLERVHLGWSLRHIRNEPEGHPGLTGEMAPTMLTVTLGNDGLAEVEAWMMKQVVKRLAVEKAPVRWRSATSRFA